MRNGSFNHIKTVASTSGAVVLEIDGDEQRTVTASDMRDNLTYRVTLGAEEWQYAPRRRDEKQRDERNSPRDREIAAILSEMRLMVEADRQYIGRLISGQEALVAGINRMVADNVQMAALLASGSAGQGTSAVAQVLMHIFDKATPTLELVGRAYAAKALGCDEEASAASAVTPAPIRSSEPVNPVVDTTIEEV